MMGLFGLTALLDWASEKLSRALYFIAAAWMFFFAILILLDVLARGVFNMPILGIPEIVGNSIVSIAFLQLGHTIRMKAMLRAEIIDTVLGPTAKHSLNTLWLVVGAIFFGMIAFASWDGMFQSWATGEYEGEGGLRVPVYPVRTILVICSWLACLNYVLLAWRELAAVFGHSDNPTRHDPKISGV